MFKKKINARNFCNLFEKVSKHIVFKVLWVSRRTFLLLALFWPGDVTSDDQNSDDVISDDVITDDIITDDVTSDDVISDDVIGDDVTSDDVISYDISNIEFFFQKKIQKIIILKLV